MCTHATEAGNRLELLLWIIGLAVFFALFCRAKGKDEEAAKFIDDSDDPMGLDADEEYLHNQEVESPFTARSTPVRANRLEQGEVVWAREKRLKEIQMWWIVRGFLAYSAFLSLLFLLVYSNDNVHAFYQVQHLRDVFHNSRQIDGDFTKVGASPYPKVQLSCIRDDRLQRSISTGTGWNIRSLRNCVRRAGTTEKHPATCLAFSTIRPVD